MLPAARTGARHGKRTDPDGSSSIIKQVDTIYTESPRALVLPVSSAAICGAVRAAA
jgi:hypothetical protein